MFLSAVNVSTGTKAHRRLEGRARKAPESGQETSAL
jgi:hypothetical protein